MAEAGVEGGHAADEGGYEAEAMAVVEAIATNARAELIVNTANASALPFLDSPAVVEVPALVDRSGPRPLAVGDVPDHARALIETIKAVERATIQAALDRLQRAGGRGARAAPARALGDRRARDLRRLPRPAARARGALR